MRILSLLYLTPLCFAFSPNARPHRVHTDVSMDRRTALSKAAILAGIVASPELSRAFSEQSDDNWVEPAQQRTDGKLVSKVFELKHDPFLKLIPCTTSN